MRVQKMINNRPCVALGGRMTRSQALFGVVDACPVLPDADFLIKLLQFER